MGFEKKEKKKDFIDFFIKLKQYTVMDIDSVVKSVHDLSEQYFKKSLNSNEIEIPDILISEFDSKFISNFAKQSFLNSIINYKIHFKELIPKNPFSIVIVAKNIIYLVFIF